MEAARAESESIAKAEAARVEAESIAKAEEAAAYAAQQKEAENNQINTLVGNTQNVYYKNCTVARNAGVTPIYQGEPGYAAHLDRDRDGIACE